MVEPFVNRLELRIVTPSIGGGGGAGRGSSNRGRGDLGGHGTLSLPEVVPVREPDWATHSFTENDALRIVRSPADDDR